MRAWLDYIKGERRVCNLGGEGDVGSGSRGVSASVYTGSALNNACTSSPTHPHTHPSPYTHTLARARAHTHTLILIKTKDKYVQPRFIAKLTRSGCGWAKGSVHAPEDNRYATAASCISLSSPAGAEPSLDGALQAQSRVRVFQTGSVRSEKQEHKGHCDSRCARRQRPV